MSGIQVLLVDDNEEFLAATKERLELRELVVQGAASGEQAVRLSQEQVFDVAVLDLTMPGMDGVETLRRVKQNQPFMQAIMLTGHGSYEAALESGRSHAFKFLDKPVDIGDLVETLHEAYRRKRVKLKEAYQAELEEINRSASTSREIISRVRELSKKYER